MGISEGSDWVPEVGNPVPSWGSLRAMEVGTALQQRDKRISLKSFGAQKGSLLVQSFCYHCLPWGSPGLLGEVELIQRLEVGQRQQRHTLISSLFCFSPFFLLHVFLPFLPPFPSPLLHLLLLCSAPPPCPTHMASSV